MFAIGDEDWPGLSKLLEEAGEVIQVGGKLMGSRGKTKHWSGDLNKKLIEELGDLQAAIDFFVYHNMTMKQSDDISDRADRKFNKFNEWHEGDE